MNEYFAHQSAFIDSPCKIGKGTKIWHFCHVMAHVAIGEKCTLGQNVYIDSNVQIGNNVKIQNNVSIFKGVTLEDDVFCGPSCVFTNVINPRSKFPKHIDDFHSTIVGQGATIGANSTIICGVTIGQYAFIGAGSVVTKSISNYALVVGNPARRIGWMSEAGVKLYFPNEEFSETTCNATGTIYRITRGENIKKIEI